VGIIAKSYDQWLRIHAEAFYLMAIGEVAPSLQIEPGCVRVENIFWIVVKKVATKVLDPSTPIHNLLCQS
jgi:hypothetical protein